MFATRSFENVDVGISKGSAVVPVSMPGAGVASLELKTPLDDLRNVFSKLNDNIDDLANQPRTPLDDLRDVFLKIKDGIQDLVANSKEALGIEKKQDLIGQTIRRDENIKGEDTDKAPKEDTKSFIQSLKDAFEGLTDNQTAKDFLQLFLLAAGFFALTKLAEKFKDKIAPILKFIKEELFPSLDELRKDTEDSLIGLGGLSKLGLFAKLSAAIGGIAFAITKLLVPFGLIAKSKAFRKLRVSIFKFNRAVLGPRLGVVGAIGRFFNGILPTIKKISGAFTTGLKAFSKLSGLSFLLRIGGLFLRFIAWPLQLVIGLFGGLSEGLKKFKEGGGMFEVLGAFMKGVYDAIIGSTLNLIADIAGWVLKKLGFTKLGESIQNLDFSFDSIMRGVINLKNSILNFITKGINKVRKFFGKEPYKLREMIKADAETDETNLASITESKQSEKKLVSDEVAATTNELMKEEVPGEEVDFKVPEKFKGTDTEALAKSIDLKQFSGQTGFESETEGMSAADLIAIQNQNAAVLAAAKAENAVLEKESTSKPIIVQDNKVVKGGDTVSNTIKTSSPIHVEHRDQTAKALNFYMFGNAHA